MKCIEVVHYCPGITIRSKSSLLNSMEFIIRLKLLTKFLVLDFLRQRRKAVHSNLENDVAQSIRCSDIFYFVNFYFWKQSCKDVYILCTDFLFCSKTCAHFPNSAIFSELMVATSEKEKKILWGFHVKWFDSFRTQSSPRIPKVKWEKKSSATNEG